jgi:hypothetical protein
VNGARSSVPAIKSWGSKIGRGMLREMGLWPTSSAAIFRAVGDCRVHYASASSHIIIFATAKVLRSGLAYQKISGSPTKGARLILVSWG